MAAVIVASLLAPVAAALLILDVVALCAWSHERKLRLGRPRRRP